MSGQSRWIWTRVDMNHVTVGLGYVYDISSILATFHDSVLKSVNSMAVRALPVTCQFVIPYKLYNSKC